MGADGPSGPPDSGGPKPDLISSLIDNLLREVQTVVAKTGDGSFAGLWYETSSLNSSDGLETLQVGWQSAAGHVIMEIADRDTINADGASTVERHLTMRLADQLPTNPNKADAIAPNNGQGPHDFAEELLNNFGRLIVAAEIDVVNIDPIAIPSLIPDKAGLMRLEVTDVHQRRTGVQEPRRSDTSQRDISLKFELAMPDKVELVEWLCATGFNAAFDDFHSHWSEANQKSRERLSAIQGDIAEHPLKLDLDKLVQRLRLIIADIKGPSSIDDQRTKNIRSIRDYFAGMISEALVLALQGRANHPLPLFSVLNDALVRFDDSGQLEIAKFCRNLFAEQLYPWPTTSTEVSQFHVDTTSSDHELLVTAMCQIPLTTILEWNMELESFLTFDERMQHSLKAHIGAHLIEVAKTRIVSLSARVALP